MTAPAPAKKTPSGRHWPFIIVGLLLLNVVVVATTVTVAVMHPAGVVPDYYEKSLRWDEERAADPKAPPVRAPVTESGDE